MDARTRSDGLGRGRGRGTHTHSRIEIYDKVFRMTDTGGRHRQRGKIEVTRRTGQRKARVGSIELEGAGTEGQHLEGQVKTRWGVLGQSDSDRGTRIDRVTGLTSWFMQSHSELLLVLVLQSHSFSPLALCFYI
jgi:hypothetical protein